MWYVDVFACRVGVRGESAEIARIARENRVASCRGACDQGGVDDVGSLGVAAAPGIEIIKL